MNADLNELMAALPHDTAEPLAEFSREQLERIFADLARRPVPTASLHRLWTLGELSVQVALASVALWIRRGFASAETHQRQTLETNLRLGLKIFHRLAYLRGALMKLGQTAGSFPQLIPAQIADTLDRLHFEAPPMHYSLIREVLAGELGADPDDVFQTFEHQAFAAASIGQVHRATLKSGQPVAVKIQYPGIARTIDADFRNLSALLQPLRLGKDWESLQSQFEEIRRMLQQEVDYEREIDSLRRARAVFQGEEGIVVPEVHAAFSTRRVLTMDYIPGLHLPEFLATRPPQELRNRFGAKLLFVWYRMHAARMNYADPQSGNYRFMDDGRLGLIDFGCVQYFTDEEFELLRLAYRSGEGDPAVVRELLRRGCGATDRDLSNEDYMGLIGESIRWMAEPVRHVGPFDYGDEQYLKRGVEWFARLVAKRYVRSHPMFMYFHRSAFGVKALLYRLGAQVDIRDVPVEPWWTSGGSQPS
jgi:predicted unusual protein kinase regulating ubiquinone biosynthesis (AarF/ABC1/UbiB family)